VTSLDKRYEMPKHSLTGISPAETRNFGHEIQFFEKKKESRSPAPSQTVKFVDGVTTHVFDPDAPVATTLCQPCNAEPMTSNPPSESLASEPSFQRLFDLQDEFLTWHERLNHLPFARMMNLVSHGYLPHKFLKLRSHLPPCGTCLFGKARKRAWRTKARPHNIRDDKDTHPGSGTSIDQLISHQPGLIPQSSGTLLRDKITAAVTFFADHFSGYVFGHLMRSPTVAETIEAKQAYERHAFGHGVTVLRYRADNGTFSHPEFIQVTEHANQQLSYCAVGGHHQNGIAEKKIGDITAHARTILQHAKRNWPEAITTSLWPFALKYAIYLSNSLSMDLQGNTPTSKYTNTPVTHADLDLNNYHTFGCPCYVLDAGLQSNAIGPPKWEPRSSLRIFVGVSPYHAHNVAMVLNPATGFGLASIPCHF